MEFEKRRIAMMGEAVIALCPKCGADISPQIEAGKWWFEAKCPNCGYTPKENDLADVFAPKPQRRIDYGELGKIAIGCVLILMGMSLFLGGLQLGGWYALLGLSGLFLVIAVFFNDVVRHAIH